MVTPMVHEVPKDDAGHAPDLSHHSTETLREIAALLRSHRDLTDAGRRSLEYVEEELSKRG